MNILLYRKFTSFPLHLQIFSAISFPTHIPSPSSTQNGTVSILGASLHHFHIVSSLRLPIFLHQGSGKVIMGIGIHPHKAFQLLTRNLREYLIYLIKICICVHTMFPLLNYSKYSLKSEQSLISLCIFAQKNGVITIEKNMITDIESATFEI